VISRRKCSIWLTSQFSLLWTISSVSKINCKRSKDVTIRLCRVESEVQSGSSIKRETTGNGKESDEWAFRGVAQHGKTD